MIVILFAGLLAAGVSASEAPHYGYHGVESPIEWCGLDTSFSACCEGVAQTPVAIDSKSAVNASLEGMAFDYSISSMTISNNGHTVQVSVPAGEGLLTVGETTYELRQFHWHTPSEHFLDGREYPLEMHMVHEGPGGKLLVVGVFVEAGSSNLPLNTYFTSMPGFGEADVVVSPASLSQLLPPTLKSFRYDGSLTTPPCTEGVSWVVLANPIQATQAQIDLFRTLFSGDDFPNGNRRHLQSLNGRIISTDTGSGDIAIPPGCLPGTKGQNFVGADIGVVGGLLVALAALGAAKRRFLR